MSQFIYEVSVELPSECRESIPGYMKRHIFDVLKHAAFSHAEFFIEEPSDRESFSFTTQYYVSDREAFGRYQQIDSAAPKADFMKHYGEHQPKMTRRLLSIPLRFN